MQCPSCGYENIAPGAVFCPNCRFQFRPQEPDPVAPLYEPIPADEYPLDPDTSAPVDETRLIEVLLLEPALILMIFTTGALWFALGGIANLAVTVSGVEVRYGGAICLLGGILTAWIFYRISLWRLH